MSLTRKGVTTNNTIDNIDDLQYDYFDDSNQLNWVNDVAGDNGFSDGNESGNDYQYDANGNMTVDKNKNIDHIEYNHLNLPKKIQFGTLFDTGNTTEYFYDATGVKLKKVVTMENGVSIKETQYSGAFIYESNNSALSLKFISHPEGYIAPIDGNDLSQGFDYIFQHKDHLGNIRLSYKDNNGTLEIIEEKNYYPFGLEHKGYNNVVNGTEHPYKYNGVELEESLGLDLYEMGFRQYDPAIARFTSIDPITHHSMSTYTAFDNNPVFWSDPSGADAESFIRDLFNRSSSGETWTNNNDGTFSSSNGQTADCDDCPDPPEWFTGLIDWFNGDGNYDGSGWGHGLRSYIKDRFGVDDRSAGIVETGILSMLQAKKIELQGGALQKVKIDPAIVAYEASIVLDAVADEDFKRKAFSFSTKRSVQFGGQRASGDMWEQLKDPLNPAYADTWKVAMNELTWLVRSTTITSTVNVSANGDITINHSFSDVFDLRPSPGRSSAYNTATEILGYLYHDVLGGNDQMRVNASWNTKIKK